ncbi:MAG: TetR/AcrR family transcriptional regulator [Actinomycetota bacterium]
MNTSLPPSRATLIAEAALKILDAKGARGLTHRAVDDQARLPEGSTSNLYRTRDALLGAANERLVEIDIAALKEASTRTPHGASRPADAARLLASVVESWTSEGAPLTTARYELYLEARRQPDLRSELANARLAFAALTEGLLKRIGCRKPERHARSTMALVDGLVINQLLQPSTRLSSKELRETLDRWFEGC